MLQGKQEGSRATINHKESKGEEKGSLGTLGRKVSIAMYIFPFPDDLVVK